MLIQYLSVSVRIVCEAPVAASQKSRSSRFCARLRRSMATRRLSAQPHDAREIDVRVRAGVHPFCFAAANRDDADAHDRIRFARLRKARVFHRAERRAHVQDGIARHGALVHFVIGDFRGIGRPPVRRLAVEFFGIEPVELALENFLAAAGGEWLAFRRWRRSRPRDWNRARSSPICRRAKISDPRCHRAALSTAAASGFDAIVFRSSSTRLLLPMKSSASPVGRPIIVVRLDAAEAGGLDRAGLSRLHHFCEHAGF